MYRDYNAIAEEKANKAIGGVTLICQGEFVDPMSQGDVKIPASNHAKHEGRLLDFSLFLEQGSLESFGTPQQGCSPFQNVCHRVVVAKAAVSLFLEEAVK
jgi:hypothetical protein